MTWNIAIGCFVGGAAALLVRGALRIWQYSRAVWKLVGNVEPRRRGAGTSVPKQLHVEMQQNDEAAAAADTPAANDDRIGGAS
jgi:hypothetical protein